MEDQFIIENLHFAFNIDGLETSRPMNYPASTRAEISAMFNDLSYQRGLNLIVIYLYKSINNDKEF